MLWWSVQRHLEDAYGTLGLKKDLRKNVCCGLDRLIVIFGFSKTSCGSAIHLTVVVTVHPQGASIAADESAVIMNIQPHFFAFCSPSGKTLTIGDYKPFLNQLYR